MSSVLRWRLWEEPTSSRPRLAMLPVPQLRRRAAAVRAATMDIPPGYICVPISKQVRKLNEHVYKLFKKVGSDKLNTKFKYICKDKLIVLKHS